MNNLNLPRIEIEPTNGEVLEKKDSPYYVVLPCEVKDFRSFVSGLLGKPQELRGKVEGTFAISFAHITNIYHLLEQRMAKQNDASLIHFIITVYYNDGHSVVHNNIGDFERYHPTSPCHPTGVVLSAIYLIKFRGHETPEKQEIEVVFATDPDFKDGGSRWMSNSSFEYRIVHTERTWATDIAGLLNNHAGTVITKLTGFRLFLHRYMDELAIYGALFIFMLSILVWATTALSIVQTFTLSDTIQVRRLLEFYIRSIGAFAVLGSTLFLIKMYVERTAFYRLVASITFTEHDRERLKEVATRQKFGLARYCAVWIVSIASGVFSNVIYSKNWFW